MQVARNQTIDLIRRQQKLSDISEELAFRLRSDTENTIQQFFLDTEIADSQLRMIFTCCHPALNPEDQVALTLKTVSGFGVQEIAKALVSNETTIQKRLYRAKEYIKKHSIRFEIPVGLSLQDRLDSVYTVLYLLFNEGYNSVKADELIRYDLCSEAMRLCKLLEEHRVGSLPSTFALLSLMCFQASRFNSRMGDDNTIILLQHQDRSKWDQELIHMGYHYLNRSSSGDQLSVYHIESAIAAEHCPGPPISSPPTGSPCYGFMIICWSESLFPSYSLTGYPAIATKGRSYGDQYHPRYPRHRGIVKTSLYFQRCPGRSLWKGG